MIASNLGLAYAPYAIKTTSLGNVKEMGVRTNMASGHVITDTFVTIFAGTYITSIPKNVGRVV